MESVIEGVLRFYQATAKVDYGENAIVVLNQGKPGEYDDNPTIKDYEAKGYRLVDTHFAGTTNEMCEFLTFVKSEE